MVPIINTNSYLVEVFNALAHPTRLEILELLREQEACVCHIQAMLGQRQSYISQHLNVLRQAKLVNSRKEGLRVYYQACDPGLYAVIDLAKSFLQASGAMPVVNPADFVERRKACTCPQCSGQAALPDSRFFQVPNA